MIVAVLSNKDQYTSLLANFSNIENITILCDNPSFFGFLRERNIKFETLGEELLREKWESVNTWACEKSLLWSRLAEKTLFGGIELNKALYVYFSYYLASFLKNYLLAEFIYNKYKPGRIIVFGSKNIPEFPKFNGNYFLNTFLADKGKNHNCEVISLDSLDATAFAGHNTTKEKIRRCIQSIYARLIFFGTRKKIFLIRGALKNLKPVAKKLKKNGYNVCFYGFEFRFEHFLFCLREKITYLVPECFAKDNGKKLDYKDDFLKLTDILAAKQWFKYEDADLTGFVCAQLRNNSKNYLKDLSVWSNNYANISGVYDIKGLITDEDLAPQGAFMAAFLKTHGIKSFCISHGYGPIKFCLKEQDRIFFLSETFVQSEFEKKLYCSWGWDKEHVKVSGIPRYDKLIALKAARGKKKTGSEKMKILFVGSTLREYNPAQVSYLGIRQYWVGNNMKIYLKDIIKAIEPYDIELYVRPHDLGDEKMWLDFIEKNKTKENIVFVSAKLDFLDLVSKCDSMILGYWSTAVREGVIFDIPTVVMDYSGNDDAFPFAKNNLCETARKPEEIKSIIDKICSDFKHNKSSKPEPASPKNAIFYLGLNDGNNTNRVLENITGRNAAGDQ